MVKPYKICGMEQRVLQELRLKGVFSVNDVHTLWGGSIGTARRLLTKWQKAGIIMPYKRQPISGQRRSLLLYIFTDLYKSPFATAAAHA